MTYTLFATIGLVLVHLFGAGPKFLDGTPRSIWLSAAGGMFAGIEQHAYLIALAGLVIFYGLERVAKESHAEHHAKQGEETPNTKSSGCTSLPSASTTC